jgi:hypothetical protein
LFAIRALSANSEISMINILSPNLADAPILNYIIDPVDQKTRINTVGNIDRNLFWKFVKTAINEYSLNDDQANVVESFCKSLFGESLPVTLVHGVFGAGKSFMIAVLVITLHRLWCNCLLPDNFKIVLSSMTNGIKLFKNSCSRQYSTNIIKFRV